MLFRGTEKAIYGTEEVICIVICGTEKVISIVFRYREGHM